MTIILIDTSKLNVLLIIVKVQIHLQLLSPMKTLNFAAVLQITKSNYKAKGCIVPKAIDLSFNIGTPYSYV